MRKSLIISIVLISLSLVLLMNNCAQSVDSYNSNKSKTKDTGSFRYIPDAELCSDLIGSNGRLEITAKTECNCSSIDYPNLVYKLVNGVSTYFVESDICAAAQHMGLLGLDTSTVVLLPGKQCNYFLGSIRNGITSQVRTLVGNDESFYFENFGDGECSPQPSIEVDSIKPTLITAFPADESIDVPINPSFVLTFSEPIQKGTGNISIRNTVDDSVIETINVSNENKVIVSKAVYTQVTITPAYSSLKKDMNCYILIDSSAFKDKAGNYFDGITNKNTYNFKTEVSPLTNPKLNSKVPANDKNDVVLNSNIILTFDTQIQIGSGKITIYKSNGSVFEEILVTDLAKVSISKTDKKVVTINPEANFENDKTYYIIIPNTAFNDLKGQSYDGITNINEYHFKTVALSSP